MTGTEYENYGKQYQTFQKIIAVYDTEPDNFPRWVTSELNEKYILLNLCRNLMLYLACANCTPPFLFAILNITRLMELMFDMQKYGQPPADIIKDLAPGLQFDENGMPIMPNMGAGMFPQMPGGEGLPNLSELAGNMKDGQCTIC